MREPPGPYDQPAKDVLAAEAFAVPAPDPELRQRLVVPPEDPAGIPEPHDVLAAEEFPMPAPRLGRAGAVLARRDRAPRLGVTALLGALLVLVVRRTLRARS